ncbi:hypothetical protein [Flavobacterium sp.]|uniref:hypothetical protein n=1 Tax=Flavobacterium sp. TaxID=239 RepID=UPI003D6C2FAC
MSYLLEALNFFKVLIARSFVILFRKERKIEVFKLEYTTEHIFDNSYVIINYSFRNAIYYRFGSHITLEKHSKIFNLKKFEKEFDFIVYGLFQKRKYKLKFEPQLTLNSNSFKTNFSNLNLKLNPQLLPKLTHPAIQVNFDKPIVNICKVKVQDKPMAIFHKTFNQNDFI